MKRKLVEWSVLLLLGGFSPQIFTSGTAWWNAPPSAEAQRLIADLHETDNWTLSSGSGAMRGKVLVVPGWLGAEIHVGNSEVSSQFSSSDRRAINAATSLCMRKLVTRAAEQSQPGLSIAIGK